MYSLTRIDGAHGVLASPLDEAAHHRNEYDIQEISLLVLYFNE